MRLDTLILIGAVIVASGVNQSAAPVPSLDPQVVSRDLAEVRFQEKVGVNPYIDISCATTMAVYEVAQALWLEHSYPACVSVGRALVSPSTKPTTPERMFSVHSIRTADGRRLEVWFNRSTMCRGHKTAL
jgi:hypothetical protein